MNTDEIIDMARKAGFSLEWQGYGYSCLSEDIINFAKLVAAKATEEANARSNTSWTLMCKKMVEDERNACAELLLNLDLCGREGVAADAIRARGEA